MQQLISAQATIALLEEQLAVAQNANAMKSEAIADLRFKAEGTVTVAGAPISGRSVRSPGLLCHVPFMMYNVRCLIWLFGVRQIQFCSDDQTGHLAVLHDLQHQLAEMRPEALRLRGELHRAERSVHHLGQDKADLETQIQELRNHLAAYEKGLSGSDLLVQELASTRRERDEWFNKYKAQQREHALHMEELDENDLVVARLKDATDVVNDLQVTLALFSLCVVIYLGNCVCE